MTADSRPHDVLGPVLADVRNAVASAVQVGEDIPAALELARRLGPALPQPGVDTLARWSVLAELAAVNLTSARVLEAHADALAILAEAGVAADPSRTWGVFAAEAPDARLEARRAEGGAVTLHGTKPWCSLAADIDEALVTAHTTEGRQLFRVALRQPGVHPRAAAGWVSRGLRAVTSAPVDFDGAPAEPVGAPGWYLDRAGFAYGGLGVAACWFGGAVGVAGAVADRARRRADDLIRMHLGAVDVALHGARSALIEAAGLVDSGRATGPDGELLALRVRSLVADTVERVLHHAAHALGPAPLAFDEAHAGRVADLSVYVRQHHAEADLATLGSLLASRT